MKKQNYCILLLMTMLSIFNSNAQTSKDVFDSNTPITYLGIDFSNAKCYGEGTRFNASDITTRINDLVKNEYDKYDLGEALKRSNLNKNFELTEKLNANIKDDKFFTDNESDLNKLDEATIQKIVSKYNLSGYDKGIGVIFIVDNLNKSAVEEVVWVTFFNISTKKVLFTEKATQKAGGFGLRNYWARPFYDVIKNIKSTWYKKWKSKYGA